MAIFEGDAPPIIIAISSMRSLALSFLTALIVLAVRRGERKLTDYLITSKNVGMFVTGFIELESAISRIVSQKNQ